MRLHCFLMTLLPPFGIKIAALSPTAAISEINYPMGVKAGI